VVIEPTEVADDLDVSATAETASRSILMPRVETGITPGCFHDLLFRC
jgi:hypothetical protein